MPITPTYPGVYIEEIPSGVHPITGVATSIGAFIDFFKRGLVDQAVQILSPADFELEFGGLDTRSEASYAIQQFFLNGGTQAWVVRVGGANIATAKVDLRAAPGGTRVATVSAGRRIRGKLTLNPGVWGNAVRLEVDYDTTDPSEFWNLLISEIDLQTRTVLRSEMVRNLTMRPGSPNYAVDVVNEGSRLVQLEDLRGNVAFVTSFRPAATGTLSNALPTSAVIPATGSTFDVNPGSGAKTCTLNYGGVTVSDYPTLRPFVEVAIRAADINNPLLSGTHSCQARSWN